ncbi:MAG: HAD family hydrolase [Dehalococcoidia bacterium]
MRITHVIYDLDGTLLDTEPFYLHTTDAIFARHGMRLPAEVRAMMMGRPNAVAIPLMLEHTGLPMTVEEFRRERDDALHALFPGALPTAGARELTDHLARHGIPQAVATSSSRESLTHKLVRHAAWFETFETVVLAEDVEHGKPAPDIFLEAARRMDADPAACLVFEDAPLGVDAALAAGMQVVAIPEAEHAERVAGAHAIIESLAAFDPASWGLPPFALPGRNER